MCLLLFGLLPLVPLAWFGLMLSILEAVNIMLAVLETMTLLRIMQDVLIMYVHTASGIAGYGGITPALSNCSDARAQSPSR